MKRHKTRVLEVLERTHVPITVQTITKKTGVHGPSTRQTMRILVNLRIEGIVHKIKDDYHPARYHLVK